MASRGEHVERDPGTGEVAQRGDVEVGDAEPAVGLGDDEALLRELAERLADGGPADLQVGGERELGELVPGPQRRRRRWPRRIWASTASRREIEATGVRAGRDRVVPLLPPLRHDRDASTPIV